MACRGNWTRLCGGLMLTHTQISQIWDAHLGLREPQFDRDLIFGGTDWVNLEMGRLPSAEAKAFVGKRLSCMMVLGLRKRCKQARRMDVKNRYPKWNPGKWKHGLEPAVPWWFYFDPQPNEIWE